MTNLLTIRRLPVLGFQRSPQECKQRLDANLARMVQEQVQRRHPGLRVGKRFALEWVLLQWLHAEGLMRQPVVLPDSRGRESDGANQQQD